MGLFSSKRPAPVGPPPLSQERLIEIFKKQEWHYFVDSDGDLGGHWDDNAFFFILQGEDKEILQIQSRWRNPIDVDSLETVRTCIEEWHRETMWPKCYYRIDDSGKVRVFTDHIVDFQEGASDEQLELQIVCGISTTLQFYSRLDERLAA